jgi:hypothetical protein
MLAKRVSNLNDTMVAYELRGRSVPLERTTFRSRKMLLLSILKKEARDCVGGLWRPFLPAAEDLKLCEDMVASIESMTNGASNVDDEVALDQLNCLQNRVSRLQESPFIKPLKNNLLNKITNLIKKISSDWETRINATTSTQEEVDTVEELFRQHLAFNHPVGQPQTKATSHSDLPPPRRSSLEFWEDDLNQSLFLPQAERMQSQFGRLVQREYAVTAQPIHSDIVRSLPTVQAIHAQPQSQGPTKQFDQPLRSGVGAIIPPLGITNPTVPQPTARVHTSPPLTTQAKVTTTTQSTHSTMPFLSNPQNNQQPGIALLKQQIEMMRQQIHQQEELHRQSILQLNQREYELSQSHPHTPANGGASRIFGARGNAEAPQAQSHSQNTKSVPVWKWNLKFSGEENVAEFLTQVGEYMQSRRVTERELLESASELFRGNALKWYRQVTASYDIQFWEDLAERLLIDFQGHDYNDELLDSIKNRKQRENESMVIYVAIMEDMFQRLNTLPSERERIRILRKNILPYYIHQTSLLTFRSVEEFKSKCKLLEAGKLQAESTAGPSTSNRQASTANNRNMNDYIPRRLAQDRRPPLNQNNSTRIPPLQNTYSRPNQTPQNNYQPRNVYIPNTTNSNNTRQASMTNPTNPKNNDVTCWICRQSGHISRECQNRGNVIGAVEGPLPAPQIMNNGPIYEGRDYQQLRPVIYYGETTQIQPNNHIVHPQPMIPTQHQQPRVQSVSPQQLTHSPQPTTIPSTQPPQIQSQLISTPTTQQQIRW